jgi:acyl-CoA synthetase (AMP-forming)/AMP-acid ligase II
MDAPQTIPGLLARAAEHWADHPAIAIEDSARTLSYRELWLAVQRTAAALIASGVEPQDRVALWAPNSADWVVVALGISSAGATLVPVNTRFKPGEAGYVLEKSRTKLLCTVSEFLGTCYFEQLRAQYGGARRAKCSKPCCAWTRRQSCNKRTLRTSKPRECLRTPDRAEFEDTPLFGCQVQLPASGPLTRRTCFST